MTGYLEIPTRSIAVVPLGINARRLRAPAARRGGVHRRLFRPRRPGEGTARAGRGVRAVPPPHRQRRIAARGGRLHGAVRARIPRGVRRRSIDRAGLGGEFAYRGALDRAGKLAFLRGIDVLSVPATYDEPKGMFAARSDGERRAGGAAAPRRFHRDRRDAPAADCSSNPTIPNSWPTACTRCGAIARCATRSAQRAFEGVRAHYSIAQSRIGCSRSATRWSRADDRLNESVA